MKVVHTFFCTVEKKTYKVGDTYTGKRKDIGSFLEAPKKKVTKKGPKAKIETK